MKNIKSGAEYAQLLIDNIIEGEKELPTHEQLPINLLTYWCEEIEIQADKAWVDYISGKREHFTFDEDEFREIYFDSLTNMMRGINGNIFTYQSLIDNPQIISTNDEKMNYSSQDLESLAKIFQATEATLFFVSQSGQFSQIITKEENDKILGGIKNQQISVINSLKLIITTNKLTKEQTQNAYCLS